MNKAMSILWKTLVRPFYRQNAGQFIFIFIVFFGAVGEIGGKAKYTGPILQLEYQYALINGLLTSRILLGLVFIAWLIYAEKCAQFVLAAIQRPDHSFLYLLNRLSLKKMYGLLFLVQCLLYLPILLYTLAIIAVAIYKGQYLAMTCIAGYILLICLFMAARFQYQLHNPGKPHTFFLFRSDKPLPSLLPRLRLPFASGANAYWQFIIRYAVKEQKLLLTGIKLFSCGVLYLGMKAVTGDDYDIRMPVLLYSIGLFGHGVLIYRFRDLEERTLLFYRGLPVSLTRRLYQYGLLYFMLYIPEIITITWLVPRPLHYTDAMILVLSGYSLLLLLNSILFLAPVKIKDYLKIVFCIFLVLYFCVLAGMLLWLAIVVLIAGMGMFFLGFYHYESAWPGNESGGTGKAPAWSAGSGNESKGAINES
jgi:hypothetical protein